MSDKQPSLKDLMGQVDPQELLARLTRANQPRKATTTLSPVTEAPVPPASSAPAQETPSSTASTTTIDNTSDLAAALTAAPQKANCDVWKFLVAPIIEHIKSAIQQNPLLPIFLVENPYPNFSESISEALIASLSSFKVLDIDDIGEKRLSNLLLTLTGTPPKGLLLLCTSRTKLPHQFGSMVREDGYLTIPAPTFERLQGYAKSCRGVELAPADAQWTKWIGPQELLVGNLLSNEHWKNGLAQLAKQRQESQSEGRPRKLDELYGIDSARNWARQLLSDIELANSSKIDWNEVDRGALFAGPPGTGKTTLARAIATECGVNFIAVSPVKDWMTGDGLDESIKQMATTFSQARQQQPTILFIDEIDSIGNREQFQGQNASWNTAFLNALLTEMDGFGTNQKIVIIGATNYPENVDPAIRRSGRLDRVIQLNYPTIAALESMYSAYLKQYNCNLSAEELHECASSSLGLTGADVEKLVRGARRRARLDGNRAIRKNDILEEIYSIPPDAERQPKTTAELKNTAYHEAGHALVGLLLPSLNPQVRMASILASNNTLGFVAITQSEQNATRTSLLDRLCMTLAGRASEQLVFGDANVTTGAGGQSGSSDLAVARRIALAYVSSYGFSEQRPNWQSDSGYEDEAAKLVQAQSARAFQLLDTHRHTLDNIATQLLQHQVLTREGLLAQLPEAQQ